MSDCGWTCGQCGKEFEGTAEPVEHQCLERQREVFLRHLRQCGVHVYVGPLPGVTEHVRVEFCQ